MAAGEFNVPRGELLIGAPIVFGRLHLLPVVVDFLRAYPEVDVRLALADRVVDLLEEHIDVAVRIGVLPDSSLKASTVGSVRNVLCASPAYFAANGHPATPQELSAHDCVSFAGPMSAAAWRFALDGAAIEVPIRARLVVNTAEAAIDAAIAGAGITRVLSYQCADALASGTLLRTLQEFDLPAIPVSLLYPAQGRMPVKLRAFIDFAAPRLRARLAATGNRFEADRDEA